MNLSIQKSLCTPESINLELELDGNKALDGVFKPDNFINFVGFEANDGVEFSNLLSDGIENVIKIKAERWLTSLTIATVIFGLLLTLNPDQEGKTHRQNQLRENRITLTKKVCFFYTYTKLHNGHSTF